MPNQLYVMPNQLYVMPNQLYVMPNQLYGMPNQLYVMPNQLYVIPNQLYVMPNQLYVMPNQLYVMPNQLYVMPNQLCFDIQVHVPLGGCIPRASNLSLCVMGSTTASINWSKTTIIKGVRKKLPQKSRLEMSLVTRKPVFWVFDQVRLKPACTAPEARWRLEISDIETRSMILPRQRNNKGADQTARMRRLICAFVVRIWHKQVFS